MVIGYKLGYCYVTCHSVFGLLVMDNINVHFRSLVTCKCEMSRRMS